MAPRDRTWIEISASAVRHNLQAFQQLVGPQVGVMPIIKANAYGHGLAEMSKIFRSESYTALGVAYGQEALTLRALKHRGRVVVLSSWETNELKELLRQNIEVAVWDWSSLRAVQRAAQGVTVTAKVHLKLDSGTTRIGFVPTDIQKLRSTLQRNKHFSVVGIFSHFANAEEASTARTKNQLKHFTTLEQSLEVEQGVERHIACTAAVVRYPEAHFGLVRLGIGLYGLWPSDTIEAWSKAHQPRLKLQPVLSWYTKLEQVKTVATGTGIGYGSTVIAKRPMRVAIVPIGYGDGYDRRCSNVGWMMVRGQRAPVVGRVCMNLTMIDVTNVPAAHSGDLVTIVGHGVPVIELAKTAGILHYELVTRLSPTIKRAIV